MSARDAVHGWADAAATAALTEIDGRRVVRFRIAGGKHHGAIGVDGSAHGRSKRCDSPAAYSSPSSASSTPRAPNSATVLPRCTRGDGLHASSCRSRDGSPRSLAVTGACVSGPALALGLFDHVVHDRGRVRVRHAGPRPSHDFTGVRVSSRPSSAARAVHDGTPASRSLVAADELAARDAIAAMLWYLPDHHLADPPFRAC